MFRDEYENDQNQSKRSILELSSLEARAFFLKNENYFNADMPEYINFTRILKSVNRLLEKKQLKDYMEKSPAGFEKVNYRLYSNKNGKYDWRPLEFIHPVLYVSMVHAITSDETWACILSRFSQFSSNPKIHCRSLPVESLDDKPDKAQQISNWWVEIEQRSIELSLEFDYIYQTDITDCYGSIYTHSIPWALHDRDFIKQDKNRRNLCIIGNRIDKQIRDMNFGQTNGIPQGSVLMDFIAEIVLGYADILLSEKIEDTNISDYTIIRYRDDYRIFVNNPQDGEKILKKLTEVLIELGMKLNASKTFSSANVIQDSIKKGKLAWMSVPQKQGNIQSQLLLIYDHSLQYMNSGSLCKALDDLYTDIKVVSKMRNINTLISIVTEIALLNPRTLPVCVSILSKLLNPQNQCNISKNLIIKIKNRFAKVPNTGLIDIWMQRLTLPCLNDISYSEPVCQIVDGADQTIWNNDWLCKGVLKKAIDPNRLVLRAKLKKLNPVIQKSEFSIFQKKISEYS